MDWTICKHSDGTVSVAADNLASSKEALQLAKEIVSMWAMTETKVAEAKPVPEKKAEGNVATLVGERVRRRYTKRSKYWGAA